MVLVVVANVQVCVIEDAIIAECFLAGIERVVLLHPARSHGMKADGKEKGTSQIPEAGPAAEIENRDVVGDGAQKIHDGPGVPNRDRFQTGRPRQLKNWKKEQPESFAIPFVADEPRLPLAGDVGIRFVVALMSMVLEMVNAKTDRPGKQVRQIGDNGDKLVQNFGAKNEIVGRIMDNDVAAMVGESPEPIGDEQTHPPAIRTEPADALSDRSLNRQDQHGDERGVRIPAHQRANFRIRLQDRARSLRMRLFEFGVIKGPLHRES